MASADPNPVQRWLTNFHRSLFLDDAGRIVMALGALAMLVLSLSGVLLVARRAGGWRRWFSPLKGPLAGRLHVEIARIAVAGLMLSSATALWMTASTFGLLPDEPRRTGRPGRGQRQDRRRRWRRSPCCGDTPVSGAARTLLSRRRMTRPTSSRSRPTRARATSTRAPARCSPGRISPAWERVSETIYMLHTGQGAAALGLILGLMALGVPVMGATGTLIWLAARRGRPRLTGNAPLAKAETIILVGSEGGSTWGFAATLHRRCREAGQSVHAAPHVEPSMPPAYARARASSSSPRPMAMATSRPPPRAFSTSLRRWTRRPPRPLAVLGFGDSSFPAFCGYAQRVSDASPRARAGRSSCDLATVDRQSPQDFARWGRELGAALGLPLDLVHQPVPPAADTAHARLAPRLWRRGAGADRHPALRLPRRRCGSG